MTQHAGDWMMPVLIGRHCGGWLALSPPGVEPRIGVTALTSEEAIAQFNVSLAAWRRDLQGHGTAQAIEE